MERFIDSTHNKIIKEINCLKNKKDRDKRGLFILEGERLISEISNDWEIKYIAMAKSYKGKRNYSENVYIMSDSLFEKISDTVNPQGVLAVCSIKDFDAAGVDLGGNPFYVILENVMDPGNMGTIIRTADAAGADGIFLSKGCVDIYNPKVIRSTMGSIFHLPIYRNINTREIVKRMNACGIITMAAHLKGNTTPYNVNMKGGCAVIIGNEANGLSDELSNEAGSLVRIPMPGKAESMNAGIAAGILIYEAVRQRLGDQYEKNKLG